MNLTNAVVIPQSPILRSIVLGSFLIHRNWSIDIRTETLNSSTKRKSQTNCKTFTGKKYLYYMAVSHKDWELPNSRI